MNANDDHGLDPQDWAVATLWRRKLAAGPEPIVVVSKSMVPFARPGDTLIVDGRVIPRVGDAALVVSAGRAILHRVIRRGREEVVTKGDASPVADPPVPAARVLGVAVHLRTADGADIPLTTGRARHVALLLAAISRGEAALAGARSRTLRSFFYWLHRTALTLIRP